MGRITEFGVDLAEGWFVLPSGAAPEGWAEELAARAASGLDVAVEDLARISARLTAVAGAVTAAGVRGASTAVLVSPLNEPPVQAMLTVVLGRSIGEDVYDEQLAHVVEAVPSAQVMGKQQITAELPAGTVRGAHFLVGHLPDADLVAGVHLEERVHLGVFPAQSADMIDVTAIAASIGVFEDFAAFVVETLQGLDVTVEGI